MCIPGAHPRRVSLTGVHLIGVHSRRVSQACIPGVHPSRVSLTGVSLTGVHLLLACISYRRISYRRASLTGIYLAGMWLYTCDFLTALPIPILSHTSRTLCWVACGGVLWCPRMVPLCPIGSVHRDPLQKLRRARGAVCDVCGGCGGPANSLIKAPIGSPHKQNLHLRR